MYQKIIIPIDLSHVEKAPQMVAAAKKLAGEDAKIWLVHAVEGLPGYAAAHVPGGVLETSRVSAREQLEKLADELCAGAAVEVRDGKAATVVLDVAEENGADAIVIASHRPDLSDYLLGSTAARVVRHAQCTVVVLR